MFWFFLIKNFISRWFYRIAEVNKTNFSSHYCQNVSVITKRFSGINMTSTCKLHLKQLYLGPSTLVWSPFHVLAVNQANLKKMFVPGPRSGNFFFQPEPIGTLTILFSCWSSYSLMLTMISTLFVFFLSFLLLLELSNLD